MLCARLRRDGQSVRDFFEKERPDWLQTSMPRRIKTKVSSTRPTVIITTRSASTRIWRLHITIADAHLKSKASSTRPSTKRSASTRTTPLLTTIAETPISIRAPLTRPSMTTTTRSGSIRIRIEIMVIVDTAAPG